jgi:hypothetical protein
MASTDYKKWDKMAAMLDDDGDEEVRNFISMHTADTCAKCFLTQQHLEQARFLVAKLVLTFASLVGWCVCGCVHAGVASP